MTVAEVDVLRAIVDEVRNDDPWVSGNDLYIRIGATLLERLRAAEKAGQRA